MRIIHSQILANILALSTVRKPIRVVNAEGFLTRAEAAELTPYSGCDIHHNCNENTEFALFIFHLDMRDDDNRGNRLQENRS